MRRLHAWVVLVCLSFPTAATAHTSAGGGGSSDPNADCLRWEVVAVGTGDAGAADAADASAADADASSASSADAGAGTIGGTLVCVEHATMFGCACAVDGGTGGAWAGASATALGAALALGLRRRRRGRPGRREVRR